MRSPKTFIARAIAGAGLAICSVVAVAEPALAQTITRADCAAGGGTIVNHGSWVGCAGISPHHIKVID